MSEDLSDVVDSSVQPLECMRMVQKRLVQHEEKNHMPYSLRAKFHTKAKDATVRILLQNDRKAQEELNKYGLWDLSLTDDEKEKNERLEKNYAEWLSKRFKKAPREEKKAYLRHHNPLLPEIMIDRYVYRNEEEPLHSSELKD